MADRIILICVVALAGVYFFFTNRISSLAVSDPLGPKAFPNLLGICLLVCAGLLAAEMMRTTKNPTYSNARTRLQIDGRHLWVVSAVCVWFAAYIYFFDRAGFILATSVFLLAMMAYFHRGHWVANILTALLFPIGTYILFDRILSIPLPTGLIPF